MDKQTAELIRELAEKLGTTAEHLWGVLVKQAPISASATLAIGIPITVGWILWRKWLQRANKTHLARKEYDYDSGDIFIPVAFVGVALITATAFWIFELPMVASAFLNPEYWALKQLWQ